MQINMESRVMYNIEQIIRSNFPQINFSFVNMWLNYANMQIQISYKMYNSYYYFAFDTDLPPDFSIEMSIGEGTSCSFSDDYLTLFSNIIIQKILAKIKEINNI